VTSAAARNDLARASFLNAIEKNDIRIGCVTLRTESARRRWHDAPTELNPITGEDHGFLG
jgi:hypothetical protein